MVRAMTVWLILALSACGGKQAGSAISGLAGGGSEGWDAQVGALMLANYDGDSSGTIDTEREVRSINCATWQSLDAGLTAGGEYTHIRQIYGFAEGFIWVGSAIGFDPSVRELADSAMASCGLTVAE